MAAVSYPTALSLPSDTLLPTTYPTIRRTLNRLTRPALISLALDWLADVNQSTTAPYLQISDEEDDDLYPPAPTLEELRRIYTKLGEQGGTKRDVIERILLGDWRNGISLYALAMADMQILYSHPTSQKWLAFELVPLSAPSSTPLKNVPHFHPATFLRNLQRESLPDVKAHYSIDRHDRLLLLILRIWVLESPYNTLRALPTSAKKSVESSRTFYVAFPDFSPYIYISSANTPSSVHFSLTKKAGDTKSLSRIVIEAIPKAFSRPHERYKLQSTGLSTRNIDALVEERGNGRTNAAGGSWRVYAETDGKHSSRDNPLRIELSHSSAEESDPDADELASKKTKQHHEANTHKPETLTWKRKRDTDSPRVMKKRKQLAQSRFGSSALPNDGKGMERFHVKMEDPFPNDVAELDELGSLSNPPQTQSRRKSQAAQESADSRGLETESWKPNISLTFTGTHVFAGIRKLIEYGVVDGFKLPGWMTGEGGISTGVIREGRIQKFEEKPRIEGPDFDVTSSDTTAQGR